MTYRTTMGMNVLYWAHIEAPVMLIHCCSGLVFTIGSISKTFSFLEFPCLCLNCSKAFFPRKKLDCSSHLRQNCVFFYSQILQLFWMLCSFLLKFIFTVIRHVKLYWKMYLYFVSLSFRQFDMFQIPVQNLDNIRRSRKKVKGILVDIGLDSCQELLQVKKKTFKN